MNEKIVREAIQKIYFISNQCFWNQQNNKVECETLAHSGKNKLFFKFTFFCKRKDKN
jgi:hypothetical protein